MKVSDLMIGDYVTATPSGMLIQVAATHKRKVAYHACTSKLSWVREGLLRPIPLTLEIFEKIGFMPFFASQFILPVESTEICVIIAPMAGLPNANAEWIVSIKNGYTDVKIPITYIHELQHALKLCGIEKEIEL